VLSPNASHKYFWADPLTAEIYRLCDSAQTPAGLDQRLASRGASATTQEIESALTELLEAKVLLSPKGKLLALGVPSPVQAGFQASRFED
jgi:hypothetical protein